jgi:hypothetical protein
VPKQRHKHERINRYRPGGTIWKNQGRYQYNHKQRQHRPESPVHYGHYPPRQYRLGPFSRFEPHYTTTTRRALQSFPYLFYEIIGIARLHRREKRQGFKMGLD